MRLSLPDVPRPLRYEANAPVLSHERIIRHEFEIVFFAPEVARAAQPGQFVELLYGSDHAPLLRRPFSLYRVDPDAGTCSILYLARGSFTSGLARMRPGDEVNLLGPLGRPFWWDDEPAARHILVAGGIGAPPLYALAREICRQRVDQGQDTSDVVVINAARTQDLLVGMNEFGGLNLVLHAVTDDGSYGSKGVATDVLTALLDDVPHAVTRLYACGPTPLLKAVAGIALARGLSCQVSVETSMPCGIGTCYGCAIPVHDSDAPEGFAYARACWDGPVFEARDLIW